MAFSRACFFVIIIVLLKHGGKLCVHLDSFMRLLSMKHVL